MPFPRMASTELNFYFELERLLLPSQVGPSLQGRAGEDLRPLGEGGAAPHLRGGQDGGQDGVHPEQAGRSRLQTKTAQEGQERQKGEEAQASFQEIGPLKHEKKFP